ncbi:MAG: NADP oxidoreductase [Thermoanaerobaculia bacterium]|nr:NADP oxidoreductase [Thermoanaerobaculia bacterium]
MSKVKLATVWLDGCSGCHMSFLDMDERILEIADRVDVVYSPLVDPKEFPPDVDVTIVEGGVSSEEDLHKIRMVRGRTKLLVALGDCAVTSNVPGMRNTWKVDDVTKRAYLENADLNQQVPSSVIPRLLPRALPVHEVVPVDVFLPGCPPPADVIFGALVSLLDGKTPDLSATRFGR